MDIEPTYKGYVEDENDALLILQATLDGMLKHIPRRPYEIERPYLITSGNIFIFIEEVSGIKRWTDGVSWSPSRISGKFLIYRELDKSTGHSSCGSKKPRTDLPDLSSGNSRIKLPPILSTPVSNSPSLSSNVSPKSLSPPPSATATTSPSPSQSTKSSSSGSNNGKYTGFIKKTMSVKFRNSLKETSETLHMVSYYNLGDLQNNLLAKPSDSKLFQNVKPCKELLIAMENTTLGNSNKNSTGQPNTNNNSPLFASQKVKMNALNKVSSSSSHGNENSGTNGVPSNNTAGSIFSVDMGPKKQQEQQQQHQQQQHQQQQQQHQQQQHQQQHLQQQLQLQQQQHLQQQQQQLHQHQQPQQPLPSLKRQSYQSDDSLPSSAYGATATANVSTAQLQPLAPSSKPFIYQSNPLFQQQSNTGPTATSQPTCYYSSRNHSMPQSLYPANGPVPMDSSKTSLGGSVQLYPINAPLPYYQNSSGGSPFTSNGNNTNATATNNTYPAQSNTNNYAHGHNNTNNNANSNPNGAANDMGVMMSPSLRVNYANFSNYTSQPTSLPTIHHPPQLHHQSHPQQQAIPFYQHQISLHPPPQQHAYSQPHNGPPPTLQISNSLIQGTPFIRYSSSNSAPSAMNNPTITSSNTIPFLMNVGPSANTMEKSNMALPK